MSMSPRFGTRQVILGRMIMRPWPPHEIAPRDPAELASSHEKSNHRAYGGPARTDIPTRADVSSARNAIESVSDTKRRNPEDWSTAVRSPNSDWRNQNRLCRARRSFVALASLDPIGEPDHASRTDARFTRAAADLEPCQPDCGFDLERRESRTAATETI